jgi:hypothetical protein
MALEGKGYKVDAVLVHEDTFGMLDTSVPVVTKFPLLRESLKKVSENIENDTKDGGNEAAKAFTKDRYHIAGGTGIAMDYNNFEEVMHLAVGVVSGSGAQASPFIWEPDEEITTSYSLILDKTAKRYQYTGGIIESFTLNSNAQRNRCEMDIDWMFQKLTISDTAINEASLAASEAMKHSQLTFRIGTQADALAATDALAVSDISFMWKNNWNAPEFQSGSNFIVQPIRQLPREVTLTFTASRYNSDAEISAIQDALTNGTKLQADMTWTGTASAGLIRIFQIKLPELMVIDEPNVPVSDHSPLTFTTTMRAFVNTAILTIMTDVTYEGLFKLTQTS